MLGMITEWKNSSSMVNSLSFFFLGLPISLPCSSSASLSSLSLFFRLGVIKMAGDLLHGQVPDDLGDDHVDDLGVDLPGVGDLLRELRQLLEREVELDMVRERLLTITKMLL